MNKYEFSEDPAVRTWSEAMQMRQPVLTDRPDVSVHLRADYTLGADGTVRDNRTGEAMATAGLRDGIAEPLGELLVDIEQMMLGRHKKYGPGNIAEFGPFGILVRMADKFARLKAGQQNFDDETVDNTLDDIIGYALIWKLWNAGQWPGSVEPQDNTA